MTTRYSILSLSQLLIVFCYLALITFSPSIHFISYIEFHDCQRVIQLLLLALVLLNSIAQVFGKASLGYAGAFTINDKIQTGLCMILGLAAVSSVRAIEQRQAAIEVSIFIALFYLTLITAHLYRDNKTMLVKYLPYALWISIGLYMVSFYTGYFSAMIVGRQLIWPEPFLGFSNIRLFQQYQLWGMGLICLPLLAFNLQQKIKNMLYVALAFWWVLLFYAASRGVTIGWILAMVVTALTYQKQAWPFLRIQLTTAASGLAAYWVLFKAIPNWIASSAVSASAANASAVITTGTIFRDTVSDRTDLWKVAYVMIKNFPILGVGPMNFYFYNPFGTHPHNSVLQIAAEWGLPATLIILAILAYSAKCWFKQFGPTGIKNKDSFNQQLAIILFFTMIANGAYSLVEGVIVMPISQVLMFTMIGLMIGQYTSGSWYTAQHTPTKRFHFRPILAGITLVLLVLSVMPELVRGLTSYDRALQPGERAFSMAPNTINPRIWMQQRRVEPQKPTN